MTTTVSASDEPAKVLISENGAPGDDGDPGQNGTGLNNIRKSLIDNPLCHLFKTNSLSSVISGSVTWARPTLGRYEDIYNSVQSAAIDIPREEKHGFLSEGASTNHLLWSEDLSNAAWAVSGVVVTPDNSTSPDGALTADDLTYSATGELIGQGFGSSLPSTSYTASIWLKGIISETVTVSVSDDVTQTGSIQVNLTSEWQRVQVSVTTAALPSLIVRVTRTASDNTTTLSAWGAQLEATPFATSYIQTTSASSTKSADNVTLPTYNNAPDLTKDWSIYCELDLMSLEDIGAARRLLNIVDDRFFLQYTLGLIQVGNSNTTSITSALSSPSFKLSIVHELGVTKIYIDGAEGNSGTVGYESLSTGNIYLGASNIGSLHAFCNFKDFRFYDFALNTDEVSFLS